jgi:hypothetical protein
LLKDVPCPAALPESEDVFEGLYSVEEGENGEVVRTTYTSFFYAAHARVLISDSIRGFRISHAV